MIGQLNADDTLKPLAANAARYDKKAANLARSRTVAFLKKNLA
jgi:hypothetical protein